MGHVLADRLDDARHLVPEDPGVRRFRRIDAERLEDIAEIHPGRFDIDDEIVVSAGWEVKR